MTLDITGDRRPTDTSRVGIAEEWEVRWWCTKFGVCEADLRSAVNEVGPSAADVERRLHQAAKLAFRQTGED